MRFIVLPLPLLFVAACSNHSAKSPPDLAMTIGDLAGTDGSSCAGGDGTACTLAAGGKGLCKSGACAACVTTTDDPTCNAAYGQSSTHFICGGGLCIAGCRSSADCSGQICGLSATNTCSPCGTDAQCQMALGDGNICNASGSCVSASCTNVGSACTANTADICCASGAGNSCVAGSCCTNTDCSGSGLSCVNHVCTSCPSPSPGLLVVDPTETPVAPTGADVAGCRFKTITAAVAVSPTPGTTIKVLGTQTLTGAGKPCTDTTIECFPIPVPGGVTITGDTTQVPTLQVAATKTGFAMSAKSVGISHFILDGMQAAQIGLTVSSMTASPSPAPFLDHVTARNFLITGIQVNGGALDVRAGVTCTGNNHGLELNTVYSTVNVSSSTDPIVFDSNTAAGIYLEEGSLTATGTPGMLGAGTVVLSKNLNGLQNDQTAGSAGSQVVTLNGIVAWQNANGISLQAGTPVHIHGCYVLANTANGIDFDSSTPNDPSSGNFAEFGSAFDGLNILQSTGSNKNAGAGICNHTSGALVAQGNTFSGPRDCSQASPGALTTSTSSCSGGGDLANINQTAPGSVDASHCTQ